MSETVITHIVAVLAGGGVTLLLVSAAIRTALSRTDRRLATGAAAGQWRLDDARLLAEKVREFGHHQRCASFQGAYVGCNCPTSLAWEMMRGTL